MMGSIGVTVGLVGYLLFCFIDLFAAIKFQAVRYLDLLHLLLYLLKQAVPGSGCLSSNAKP